MAQQLAPSGISAAKANAPLVADGVPFQCPGVGLQQWGSRSATAVPGARQLGIAATTFRMARFLTRRWLYNSVATVLTAATLATFGCSERVELGRLGQGSGVAGGPSVTVGDPTGLTWRADYETGDLSQWDREPEVVGNGIQVISSPVRAGGFSVRFTLRPGDDPIGLDGERAELLRSAFEEEGTESWWAWSTYFPADFVVEEGANKWTIFMHWVSTTDLYAGCRPPVALDVASDGTENLRLLVRGGVPAVSATACESPPASAFLLGKVERGRWYDFLLHIVWSASASQGLVELWLDGTQMVMPTRGATLFAGRSVYVKQGLFRSDSSATSSVIQDELRRGSGPPVGL